MRPAAGQTLSGETGDGTAFSLKVPEKKPVLHIPELDFLSSSAFDFGEAELSEVKFSLDGIEYLDISGRTKEGKVSVLPGEKLYFKIEGTEERFASDVIYFEVPENLASELPSELYTVTDGRYVFASEGWEFAPIESRNAYDPEFVARQYGYRNVDDYLDICTGFTGITNTEQLLQLLPAAWSEKLTAESDTTVAVRKKSR